MMARLSYRVSPDINSPQTFLKPTDLRTANRASGSTVPKVFECFAFGLGQGFPDSKDDLPYEQFPFPSLLPIRRLESMGGAEFLVFAVCTTRAWREGRDTATR